MERRTLLLLVLATYIVLASVSLATGRSHGLKYHHHRYHGHNHYNNHKRNHQNHQNHLADNSGENRHNPAKYSLSTQSSWLPSDEEYDYEDDGRHAYLMTTKKETSKKSPEPSEDQTLTEAFEKHMKPGTVNVHDVYAYQLPTDLWFIVRYEQGEDGQVEKYMNVVDSFTNYLEKLEDKDVQTVSVNVKGVETVFRLTPKRKADN